MKGGGLGRPPPDAGIPCDMKTLLNAFRERNSLRLIEFYEVAVNHGLKDIYAGRMSVADLVGFEECLLNAAFAYTRPRREYANGLGEEQTLMERIFGIYATFIFYYAQPIDYVSKIHVTPEDCDSLMQLSENTLIPAGHVDAYACLQRLIVDDAFRIVMSSKNHDLSNHRRYERPNPVEMLLDEQERHVPLEFASGIMKHPVLKAMKYVERKMEQKERMLSNRRMSTSDASSFLDKLQNIYATLVHELYKVDSGTEEDTVEKWKDSSSTSFCKKPETPTTKAIQDIKAKTNEPVRGRKRGREID